jgi:hypothetical protein
MSILKGSKRCILELISSRNFTTEINMLLNPTGAVINPSDVWMPKGIHNDIEAELKDFLSDNFSNQLGSDIFHWWLAFPSQETKTPNWDFVSTCTINNQKGIILVEGKAHLDELQNESKGKILRSDASENSIANHYKIGKAIEEAKREISVSFADVAISRDRCYQLSNRVAHAWWLAHNGIPVVLMYLGFIEAEDMKYGKNRIFETPQDWEMCFLDHVKQVGVDTIMDNWVNCGKGSFNTICRNKQS